MTAPELSIIIPAFNEEALITRTLDGLQTYLSTRPERYEILVVDDGSHDQTAACIENWHKSSGVDLRLLINEQNRGKGFSIQRGVLESLGSYIIFIDADLPYELQAIEGFLKALQNGCDLAIGSRVLPGSRAIAEAAINIAPASITSARLGSRPAMRFRSASVRDR